MTYRRKKELIAALENGTAAASSEEKSRELISQVGEKDGIREKLLRMCRQNKLAAFSALLILLIILASVFAPVIAPYGEAEQDVINRLQAPSALHPFGTDELGRDVFSRILYGSRVSLVIGILPSVLALVIGIILGLLAGYIGGKTDVIIMRIADIMLSIPSLLLAMVIMYTLGSSTINLFLALSMINWASVARVVRSQTLSLKESEYVEAARSIGVSRWKIMIRHILPNSIGPIITSSMIAIPTAIFSESFLAYIGLGLQAPEPSIGVMLSHGQKVLLHYPSQVVFPAIVISLLMISFNLFGNGLRDAFDPTLRGAE